MRIVRVHHIALRTADVARLEQFYIDVGLEKHSTPSTEPGKQRRWLKLGESGVLMIEEKGPEEPAPHRHSLDFLCFAVTADERAEKCRLFRERGISIESETAFTTYVRDPDGRRVGISQYAIPVAKLPGE